MADVTDYEPTEDTFDGIEVACEHSEEGRSSQLDRVRVRWHKDGSLTLSVRGGAPAILTRCYLEGQGKEVILRFEPV